MVLLGTNKVLGQITFGSNPNRLQFIQLRFSLCLKRSWIVANYSVLKYNFPFLSFLCMKYDVSYSLADRNKTRRIICSDQTEPVVSNNLEMYWLWKNCSFPTPVQAQQLSLSQLDKDQTLFSPCRTRRRRRTFTIHCTWDLEFDT